MGSRYQAIVGVVVGGIFLGACAREPTEVPSGRDLYTRYCASCHGLNGTGDGPVAPSLRTSPTDLTKLAQQSGGFDEAQMMAVIDGRRLVVAHGRRDMPVWGVFFPEEHDERPAIEYPGYRRTRTLMEYLRSLQVP